MLVLVQPQIRQLLVCQAVVVHPTKQVAILAHRSSGQSCRIFVLVHLQGKVEKR